MMDIDAPRAIAVCGLLFYRPGIHNRCLPTGSRGATERSTGRRKRYRAGINLGVPSSAKYLSIFDTAPFRRISSTNIG